MNILGISAYYHDSAAALVINGEIISAAQEERFTRKKHDYNFPTHAIKYCLKEANINSNNLDYVVFYDKPFLKFERILETYLHYAPAGIKSFVKSMPLWMKKKLWIKVLIQEELNDFKGKVLFSEHHMSHAASAFYPSPFEESAIITTDGVGEWTTTSIGFGKNNRIDILKEIHFPHSLGMLYSAFTYFTGFKVNSGEYKVMGLAPYGESKYVKTILDNLIDLKADGSFQLNMEYFNYAAGLTMTNKKFAKLFGGLPRKSESPLTQREMDLAKSVQEVIEMAILNMANYAKEITKSNYLSLAGGVALNCVANGNLLKASIFDDLWIQPAAGDAGGAIGAALTVWYDFLNNNRVQENGFDSQKGSYLGPSFSNNEILNFLNQYNIPYTNLADNVLFEQVAGLLNNEKVIGWFQDRMEFGPRALGNRSIIGDARSADMQKKMNLKIKFRESFRPFAPSVLDEFVHDYFDIDSKSPYMLLVANVNEKNQNKILESEQKLFGLDRLNLKRSDIPAVTHVDYSSRIQTVNKVTNPRYWKLIKSFHELTGCPVIVNTSFNVRGEPIVCSPSDAYKCFMRTEMDFLVMGNFLLEKINQPQFHDDLDWQQEFELD